MLAVLSAIIFAIYASVFVVCSPNLIKRESSVPSFVNSPDIQYACSSIVLPAWQTISDIGHSNVEYMVLDFFPDIFKKAHDGTEMFLKFNRKSFTMIKKKIFSKHLMHSTTDKSEPKSEQSVQISEVTPFASVKTEIYPSINQRSKSLQRKGGKSFETSSESVKPELFISFSNDGSASNTLDVSTEDDTISNTLDVSVNHDTISNTPDVSKNYDTISNTPDVIANDDTVYSDRESNIPDVDIPTKDLEMIPEMSMAQANSKSFETVSNLVSNEEEKMPESFSSIPTEISDYQSINDVTDKTDGEISTSTTDIADPDNSTLYDVSRTNSLPTIEDIQNTQNHYTENDPASPGESTLKLTTVLNQQCMIASLSLSTSQIETLENLNEDIETSVNLENGIESRSDADSGILESEIESRSTLLDSDDSHQTDFAASGEIVESLVSTQSNSETVNGSPTVTDSVAGLIESSHVEIEDISTESQEKEILDSLKT